MKNRKILQLFGLLSLSFLCHFSFAQGGVLDPDFGTDGKVTTAVNDDDDANGMDYDEYFGILLGGSTTDDDGTRFLLTRYTTSGGLDFAFGLGGVVETDLGGEEDICEDVIYQNDGKIVAVGYSIAMDGSVDFAIVRYDSYGELDETFDDDGILLFNSGDTPIDDGAFCVQYRSDEKIVVLGAAYDEDFELVMLRLNSDGSLDESFGTDGIVSPVLGTYTDESEDFKMVFDNSGNILIAASHYNEDLGSTDFSLVRYHHDGTPDLDFGTDGQVITNVGDALVDGEESEDYPAGIMFDYYNHIYVGGTTYNDDQQYFSVVRYTEDGELDSDYGDGGISLVEVPEGTVCTAISERSTVTHLIMVGDTPTDTGSEFFLLRLLENGLPDPTFGTDGITTTNFDSGMDLINDIVLTEDHKILVGGESDIGDTGNSQLAMAQYFILPDDTGIEEVEGMGLTAFPNPVVDKVDLSYTLNHSQKVSLKLTDINGKLITVFVDNEERLSGFNTESYLIPESLESGVYYLSFITENGTQVKPLILQ